MTARSTEHLRRLLDEAPYLRALASTLAVSDADDLTQAAWVRAIERGTDVESPRAWLAQVLRRIASNFRRADRRRITYERAAASTERVPSSADLMEREERRRELVRVVDELPPAQRAVVLLRYFEELPPRVIAVRLGVPVSTVWNRLRTALQTLRSRLDRRHGDRLAFLLPLLPGKSAVAAGGFVTLSAKTKSLTTVVAITLALLAWWGTNLLTSGTPRGPAGTDPVVPVRVDVQREQPPPAQETERSEVVIPVEPAAPSTGALVVRTVLKSGEVVADLEFTVQPDSGGSRFENRRVRSDAAGVARLQGLAPGRFLILGGRNDRAYARATVRAGDETHADLVVPEGIRVFGVVVDTDGVPVPGAEVHVAPAPGQRIDMRPAVLTGADGRFDLRHCTPRCLVGARAAGHAPSWMRFVNLQDGGSIELRLDLPGPGGMVEGRVFGPDSEPVEGAAVVIGEGLADILRTTNDGSPPGLAYVYSDAEGRFRAVGVQPGDRSVEARAAGLALHVGSCHVDAHVVTRIEIHLTEGFVCKGVVLDAKGKPIEDALVSSGRRGYLDHTGVETAADGSFRLEGLAPGEAEVRAFHDNRTAKATVHGDPGASVSCELRFTAGVELRGVILGPVDAPIGGAHVTTVAERASGSERFTGFSITDDKGRFTIEDCPDGQTMTLSIGAQGYEASALLDVDPRAGDVMVRLVPEPEPSVHIIGRVLDRDGRPVAQATFEVEGSHGQGPGLLPAGDGGRFECGPLSPGRWRVTVQVPGQPFVTTPWRELSANDRWDLGDLRLPVPGTVVVRTHAPEALSFHLVVFDSKFALGNWGAMDGEGQSFRSKPLAPGRHYVMAVGSGVASSLLPVDVRAGEETTVELELQRGTNCRLEFHTSGRALTERHLRVMHGESLVHAISSSGWTPGSMRMTERLVLAPGDYVVTADGDGLHGETRFTVVDGHEAQVRIEMR